MDREQRRKTKIGQAAAGRQVALSVARLSLVSRKPTKGRLGGGDGGGRASAAAKTKQLGFYDKKSPSV